MFVPHSLRSEAYEDVALPIAEGQTISQPSLVASMVDLLELDPSHRVLEVGAGSGYQAAVLSLLASQVVSVERIPELTKTAKARLHLLGYARCRIEQAGDEIGWRSAAPYDRIIVAAAAPKVPAALSNQLGPGGRMVIPVGRRTNQDLLVVSRKSDGLSVKKAGKCMFVPLIGRDAWALT
ncbi:Protein-L-isoaspartate O-methyltransferase [Geodia barretti]|nr:Protein-L-isoaspartate O-methyltransferase [Geodia barretti]